VIENQGLRYETFRDRVIKYATQGVLDPIEVIYPHFLKPNIKDGAVYSQPLKKIYKPYVGKGVVTPNFDVLDFGHIR
jgi:hypothetical protein